MKSFTPDDLKDLDRTAVPRHICVIPDGNRRWALKHQRAAHEGHLHGLTAVTNMVRAAAELGIQTVTLYTFSTENWSRSAEEVDFLMNLLEAQLAHYETQMVELGVKLNAIGDFSALPMRVQNQLQRTIERTQGGARVELILSPNYGGRNEICRAVRKFVRHCREGRVREEELDEDLMSSYLDTARWGDPDLFIRTSGEFRVSNFLLWQLSYSELYFTDTLWPDFTPRELLAAVLAYQGRKRRLGT